MRELCKKNLFLCTTQYQLINAIYISKDFNDGYQNDIVLLDICNKFVHKIQVDELKHFFDNISITNISNTKNKYLSMVRNIISKNPFGIFRKSTYENIFFSGTEIYSKIIALKFMSRYTNLFYLEDGIETYINILDKKYKKKQDFILSLFLHKNIFKITKGAFVHFPKLVIVNNSDKKIYMIKKLDDEHLQVLPRIFNQKSRRFNSTYIFLNAYFDDVNMYERQNYYIRILRDIVGEDSSLKTHPNETKKINFDMKKEDCGNFEIANLMYDMEDKVYISIFSTASITPYMLFKKKPTVIYLYNDFMKTCERKDWKDADLFIKKLVSEEHLHDKIFVVNSVDEYKLLLEKLRSQL